MNHTKLLFLLLCAVTLSSVSFGQTVLLQESFETNGEGTRYTSNTFNNAPLSDVWERTNQNPHPYHSTGIASGTNDGSFYWAGEDIQSTLGTTTDAFVRLNPVTLSGFSSLEIQIALGISRFGQNRWENDDYILVEYNMDNTGWNIIGLFMGNNASPAIGGALFQDTDNNLATFGPFGTEVTGTFEDFTFPIPVTGNSLQVRVRTNCNGSEEPGFDNIRIRGVGCPTITFNTSKQDEVCPNANDGRIDITNVSGGTGPYMYSIDGGTTYQSFQNFVLFLNLPDETYNVRVKDANGCESAIESVTINAGVDTEAPSPSCPSNITVSNTPGQCGAVVAFSTGASDNCGGVSDVAVPASGSFFNIGTTQVTVTATDAAGNTSGCNFNVMVMAPEIAVNNGSVGTDFGTVTTTNTQSKTYTITNLGTAVLNIGSITSDDGQFVATPVASTPIAANGGSSTFQVDFTPSVAGAQSATISVANNDCDENPYTFTVSGTGEDCPSGFVFNQDIGQCIDIDECAAGPDACPPGTLCTNTNGGFLCTPCAVTALCQNVTVQVNAAGIFTLTPETINGGSSSVCGDIELAVDQTEFTCSDIGSNTTAELTVTNNGGGESTCTAMVTVEDGIAPNVNCPSDVTVSNDPGLCNAVVDFAATATDNCGATISYSTNPSVSLNTGYTLAETFATGGLLSGFAQDLIFGPDGNLYVAIESGTRRIISYTPTGTPLGDFVNPGDLGLLTALEIAFGPDGNLYAPMSSNGFSADVREFDGSTGALLNADPSGAVSLYGMDFGPDGALYIVHTGGVVRFDLGTNTGTSFISDAALLIPFGLTFGPDGNIYIANSTAGTILRYNGTTGAFIDVFATGTGFALEILFGPDGNLYVSGAGIKRYDGTTGALIDTAIPGSARGIAFGTDGSIYVARDSPTRIERWQIAPSGTFSVGTTTVTATATDAAGNTDNCSFDMIVTDNEGPTGTCNDMTLDLAANGEVIFNVFAAGGLTNRADNCGLSGSVGVTSPTLFTCADLGSRFVTIFNRDIHGNETPCTVSLTINDPLGVCNQPPVASCKNITVSTAPNTCEASITPAQVDDNSTDPDNDPLQLNLDNSGPFAPGTHTIELTVSDGNLSDKCTAMVTVADNQNPVISCPADITVNNDPGQCGAEVSYNVTFADNCPSAALMVNPISGSFFSVGSGSVLASVTDAAGNTAQCSFNVNVKDNENPNISCPADITVNNDQGQCGAVVNYNVTFADNCPSAALMVNPTSGSFFSVGSGSVLASVADAAGNTAQCSFIVNVKDNEVPTFSNCPDPINLFNDAGDCGAIANWTSPTLGDNCPESTSDSNYDPGDFFPVGTTTVTYSGSDKARNQAIDCSFTVSVTDAEKPKIACPGDISTGTDAGQCGATVTFSSPITGDNCEVAEVKARYRPVDDSGTPLGSWTSRVFDPSGFFPVGRYQVQWRVKDIYGNKESCSHYLDVYDDEDPVAVCKDLTIDFNGQQDISLSASQVWNEAASADNCGFVEFVSANLTIGCEELGNTVAIPVTIRDEAGNTDVCTSYVDVIGLPCGWSEGPNDGSLNCDGQTTSEYDVDDESFSLTSDGCWHDCREADKATYVYHPLCGDGTLTAELASINTSGYAGLMARESLDPWARRAGVLKNYSTRRVRREWRASYGGIVSQAHSNRSRVKWLRIVRDGNQIKSYTSTNGSYWRLLYKVTYSNLDDCIYVGMMTYSLNGNAEVNAVFENVTLSGSGTLAGGALGDPTVVTPEGLQAWGTAGDIGNGTIEVFPNPASNQAQLILEDFQDKPAQLIVRDAFGKMVRQIDLDSAMGVIMPLEVQDLTPGVYIISLVQDRQLMGSKRLVVQP